MYTWLLILFLSVLSVTAMEKNEVPLEENEQIVEVKKEETLLEYWDGEYYKRHKTELTAKSVPLNQGLIVKGPENKTPSSCCFPLKHFFFRKS